MNKLLLALIGIVIVIGAALLVVHTESSSEVKTFSSTSDLEKFLAANQDSTSNGNTESQAVRGGGAASTAFASDKAESGASGSSSSLTAPSAPSPYSSTNVQVQGVDEADIVKTDGEYIYTISGSKVVIVKAVPSEDAHILTTIETNGTVSQMFIKDDTLIIIGQESYYYSCPECDTVTNTVSPPQTDADVTEDPAPGAEEKVAASSIAAPYYYRAPKSFVSIYDVSDKENPKKVNELLYDGSYYSARMIDNYLYIIAQQSIYGTSGGIDLPSVTYGGETFKMAAADIAYFPIADYNYQLTTVFALNIKNDDLARNSFLTGYTQTLYVSENNIYLSAPKYVPYQETQTKFLKEVMIPSLKGEARDEAESILANKDLEYYQREQQLGELFATYYNKLSSDEKTDLEQDLASRNQDFWSDYQKETQKTVIHKIAIDGDSIEYVAQGEVPGYLLNQFSLDEHKGYLRVATTTNQYYNGWYGFGGVGGGPQLMAGSTTDPREDTQTSADEQEISEEDMNVDKNHIYVLDDNLNIVGKLEDLAPTERIYSARFIGDRAYLVTFKQLDPLFVIDLADPTDPVVLGKLKIPGYSTYLHPYDENHIIGIGQDSAGEVREGNVMAAIPAGIKIALFDVSDVENPSEISKVSIGDRGTSSDALYDHHAFLFDKEKGLLVIPASVYEATPEDKNSVWYYGRYVYESAYVYSVNLDDGFKLKGKITHLNQSEEKQLQNRSETNWFYPPYDAHIFRTLYIGDTLYTISQRAIKANNLETLDEESIVKLPFEEQRYYLYGGVASAGSGGASEAGAPTLR